jgi:hypothetical protein
LDVTSLTHEERDSFANALEPSNRSSGENLRRWSNKKALSRQANGAKSYQVRDVKKAIEKMEAKKNEE